MYKRRNRIMNCIKCNGNTSVVDSRPQETYSIKRRRKCGVCGHRFNTIEQVFTDVVIVKEIVKTKKHRFKPINPFDNDDYLELLSDDELEAWIGEE
jgi:transcriptional regulator NrdR family protein